MPNYKSHLAGGFFIYIIFLYILTNFNISIYKSLQLLLSTLFGSLFPDIDTKSKIQKLFYSVLLMIFVLLTLKNQNQLLITFSFFGLVPLVVDHRGIFHKSWFIILISSILLCLAVKYYPTNYSLIVLNIVFFALGAFSHLFLDLGFKKMFRI